MGNRIEQSERRIKKHQHNHGSHYMEENWYDEPEFVAKYDKKNSTDETLVLLKKFTHRGKKVKQRKTKEGRLVHEWDAGGIKAQRVGFSGSLRYITTYESVWVCGPRGWQLVRSTDKDISDEVLLQQLLRQPYIEKAERRFQIYEGEVLKREYQVDIELKNQPNTKKVTA